MDHGRTVLALFVIAALIVGTAGYDTIQADRSSDVEVANDADAYLGLQETGNTIENGSTGTVLLLTNQFGTSVDLSVDVTSTTENVTSIGLTVDGLDPGESATLDASCSGNEVGQMAVEIEANGDGVQFQTSKTLTVECTTSTG